MKLSAGRFFLALILPIVIVGCASNKVVTHWKPPPKMATIDAQIVVTECQKRGLQARKRFIKNNPTAPQKGIDSPVYKAQQAAEDACMREHGVKMTSRTTY